MNINTEINALNCCTMARYFTWCLKRTFLLTNRLKVYEQPVTMLKVNNYTIQSRYIQSPHANQINIDYDEPKGFDEFMEESKHSSSHAIAALTKILSVTRANAKKAVEDYPKFEVLPKRIICKNFQTLREVGFYKSTIKDHKYLLTDDSDTLIMKISTVQNIDMDINDAAPLFHLPVTELANFVKRSKIEASYLPACNRLLYLAEKLQCDIARICHIVSFHPLLLRLPAPKLLSVTEYILEAGMAPEHVLNDVYIYNYSISTIKTKIERAKRAGIKPLKPWVLRCQDKVWEKLENRKTNNKSILEPDLTVGEYLCRLFDCDMDSVNFILTKEPRLLTLNVPKLSNIATLLHRKGYKIEDIQRTPTIMFRSYSYLQKRFATWRKSCNKRPPLFIILHSDEKFEEALKEERFISEDNKPS